MDAVLDEAQAAWEAGRPELALALLASAEPAAGSNGAAGAPPAQRLRRLRQLQALCRIELAGSSEASWWKVGCMPACLGTQQHVAA